MPLPTQLLRKLKLSSPFLIVAGLAACTNASNGAGAIPSGGPPAQAKAARVDRLGGKRFTVLYRFSDFHNGSMPLAKLTIDASGNLYGTASEGGEDDYGTLFKVEPNGNETTFYQFDGSNLVQPEAGVIKDAAGNFYGTTMSGGGPRPGSGGIYEVDKRGKESVLHAFTGYGDGNFSSSDLIMDPRGNLWGTASEGGFFRGKCSQLGFGGGVVFKITPNHQYVVVHAFHCTDGSSPYAGLTLANGTFYGTTGFGGTSGWGTVFKMTSSGKISTLYNFTKGADGAVPRASVVVDASGNVYGTTQYGGFTGNQECDNGCGVVFKVTSGGRDRTLHAFTSLPDGAFSFGALVLGTDGNLYGTTQQGGQDGLGSAFRISPFGKQYRILHNFTGQSDGSEPPAGLALNPQGDLDGVTEGGYPGATVYQIAP